MTNIETLKLALEALEHEANIGNDNAYQRERDALRAAIAEAEKPVAWMDASETALSWENYLDGMKPLYTAPPAAQQGMTIDASAPLVVQPHPAFAHRSAAQRQPLTDDRIGQIIEQCKITLVNYCSGEKQTEFARAIEAAHGIKEKNT